MGKERDLRNGDKRYDEGMTFVGARGLVAERQNMAKRSRGVYAEWIVGKDRERDRNGWGGCKQEESKEREEIIRRS